MKGIHEMEVPSGELQHASHNICRGSFSLTIFPFPLTNPAHQDETTPPSNDDQNDDEEDEEEQYTKKRGKEGGRNEEVQKARQRKGEVSQ